MTTPPAGLPVLNPCRPCRAAGFLPGLFLAVLMATSRAWASPGVDEPMPSIEVPGGMAALARVLDIDPDAPRPQLMLSAIRVMWEGPDGQDAISDRRRAEGRGYLEMLAALERAREALGRQPGTLATLVAKLGKDDRSAFAAVFGAELSEARGRWRLTLVDSAAAVRRRRWLTAAGVDPVALVARFNAGEAVSLDRPSDTVPMLLPADVWARMIDPPPALRGSLFTGLLTDRLAALLYYGAAALDGPTRAFVGATPVEYLHHDLRGPALALTGRSLRIAGGRVLVPGGADAVALWEAVIGAPVTDPMGFMAHLFDRDEGRLALLYDGISHAHPEVRAFALGKGTADAALRLDRFKRLVAAASTSLMGWSVRTRPFERVAFDATHLLMRARMAAGGQQPAGPWSRRFWEVAFESTSIPEPASSSLLEGTGDPADAAWLIERISVANTALRRERAEAWLFAQRVFPAPANGELGDILTAVRGWVRFRALTATLERIGLTDPAAYAEVVRAADRVSRATGESAWTAIAQFQGALAIVERARFHRGIDVPTAAGWIRLLARLPLSDGHDYLGGVSAWIDDLLLPMVPATRHLAAFANAERPEEVRLMALMAGAVPSSPFGDPARMPTVEWEGLLYRVDPASATLRRMVDVRAKQGGPSLDGVLAVSRAARATLTMASLNERSARIDALSQAVAALQGSDQPRDGGAAHGQPDLAGEFSGVRRKLQDLKVLPPPGAIAGLMRPLARACDWYLARALAAIVYAPNLGEPDSPALLGGDPSPNHDFGLADTRFETRVQAMWRLPVEERDRAQRWRVTGSLLGLDVALDRFALRRLPSEVMPPPPMLTDVERQALTEPVALVSPFDYTDEASRAVVTALAAGRARIASATAESIGTLAAEADLDEWRAHMLPWVLTHEPSRVMDVWSLGEVLELGLGGGPRPPGLDAWGGSGLSMDGNLACALPRHRPWATLSGRKGARLVPALVPDLGLALAESLAALNLPARMSAGVLAVATQELLDTIRVNHDDDWPTLVAHAKKAGVGHIEDYVAALTIGGPLVPADTETHHANIW